MLLVVFCSEVPRPGMALGTELTGDDEVIKKRQTDIQSHRHRAKLGNGGLASLVEKPQPPELSIV